MIYGGEVYMLRFVFEGKLGLGKVLQERILFVLDL